MSKVRLPLIGSVTARSIDINKDQHFINCLPMSNKNLETEEKKLYLKKRAGTIFINSPSADETNPSPRYGRGVYYWEENNTVYYVSGNTLYYSDLSGLGGTALIPSISTASTKCGFVEFRSATNGLFFCDGISAWTISSTNVVVEITDVGFPSPHQPTPVYMDGYVFLLDADGRIHNSGFNVDDAPDPTVWPGDFITPEMYPDKAIALSRQANQVVAVGTYSVEFFYDDATETGSPLARTSQATLQTGSHHSDSVASVDGLLMFVASSKSGGIFVAAVESLRLRPVSDEAINRILEGYIYQYGTSGINFTSSFVRTDGHFLYILNVVNTSDKSILRTLVYDVVEKMWHEWSGIDAFLSADRLGTTIIQDRETSYLYYLDQRARADKIAPNTPNGTPFTVTIQTAIYDGGGYDRKFCRKLYLVGDFTVSFEGADSFVTVQWSDDDYNTWSSARTLNLNARGLLTQCGAFRRRAFKIIQTNTQPLRLDSIEMDLDTGTH